MDLKNIQNNDEVFNIRQIIEQYLYYWKWFVISALLFLGGALAYLKIEPKKYNTSAQILLNDKKQSSPAMALMKEINPFASGYSSANSTVVDEIKIIKSRRLIAKAVEKHSLNISYFKEEILSSEEILHKNSPLLIKFENDSVMMNPSFSDTIELRLTESKVNVVNSKSIPFGEYDYDKPVKTKFGNIYFQKQSNISKDIEILKIKIEPFQNAIDGVIASLRVTPDADKQSMAINFEMIDNIPERAELIINSLINIYKQDTKDDDSKIAIATSEFITNRLNIISKDLENVDGNIADFKKNNNINNTGLEAGAYFKDALEVDKQVVEISTQLEIAKQLSHTLNSAETVLLPTNIGIDDPALSSAINNYNQAVLTKQDLSKSVTDSHIEMSKIDHTIADLKINIKQSLRLYQNNLSTQLKAVEDKKNQLNSRLTLYPQQEKGFTQILRQQKIVESIYLFLLEKREEAEIKASSEADSFKVIDYANTKPFPISPKRAFVILGAMILGIIIPFVIVYVKLLLDNKVKDKKDIEAVYDGSILGDIPRSDGKIIAKNDRSALAESLRIIRTNLSYLLPAKFDGKIGQVIYVTSTIPGEGKTFTAANIAQILGLTNKKTILLGADIRKPRLLETLKTTSYKGHLGLTQYLADYSIKYDELIIKKPTNLDIDVIHSGVIPPNPAELLSSSRFSDLLEELKKEYDYVVVDTAPVGPVTDSKIIADFADVTLYVVRADFLDKRMLDILQDNHINAKLKNISVIINDVNYSKKTYSYGYGYGEEHKKKKKFWLF